MLPPISFLEGITFFTISFMVLITLGEATLILIERLVSQKLRNNRNVFDGICLNFALGVSMITILAAILTPFRIFNIFSSYGILIVSLTIIVLRIVHSVKKSESLKAIAFKNVCSSLLKENWKIISCMPLVAICAYSIFVRFKAIEGLYVFPWSDAKGHSFITFLIMRYCGYVINEGLIFGDVGWIGYPQGFHAVAAYLGLIFMTTPERSVTMLNATIASILPLTTYLVAKTIFKNYWVGVFSSLVMLFSCYTSFDYGGMSVITSMLISMVFIAFLYGRERKQLGHTIILGILLGGIINTNPQNLLLVGAVVYTFFLLNLFKGSISKLGFINAVKKSIITLLIGLASSAFTSYILIHAILSTLHRLFSWSTSISSWINQLYSKYLFVTAPDVTINPESLEIVSWWFQLLPKETVLNFPCSFSEFIHALAHWISYWNVPRIRPIIGWSFTYFFILCFVSVLSKRIRNELKSFAEGILVLGLCFLPLFLAFQANPEGILPPIYPLYHFPEKIAYMGGWVLTLFIGCVFFLMAKVCVLVLQSLLSINVKMKIIRVVSYLQSRTLPLILLLVINGALTVNFASNVYNAISFNHLHYLSVMHDYSPLTMDDYKLMLWVKNNIEDDAIFLVNPADAGQYLPVIAHRKVIFPFGKNQFSKSWQYVLEVMRKDPEDPQLLYFLRRFNVSYVYVGAITRYTRERPYRPDPSMLLNSKYYELVQNFGGAYLFKIRYPEPPKTLFISSFSGRMWSTEEALRDEYMAQWGVLRGDWCFKNYRLEGEGSSAIITVKNFTFSNGGVECKVNLVSGNYTAITFRLVDHDNYYRFVLCPSKKCVSFELVREGKVCEIISKHYDVRPNRWYLMRLIIDDKRFIGYINGEMVLEASLMAVLSESGELGLEVDGRGYFDFFYVYMPAEYPSSTLTELLETGVGYTLINKAEYGDVYLLRPDGSSPCTAFYANSSFNLCHAVGSMYSYEFILANLAEVEQWVYVEILVPDTLVTSPNGNPKAQLYSWDPKSNTWIPHWLEWWRHYNPSTDYPDFYSVVFLDGSESRNIYGKYKGVCCYLPGRGGETPNWQDPAYMDRSAGLITYSDAYGTLKRIGFAIKLPPKSSKPLMSGEYACLLKLEVFYG